MNPLTFSSIWIGPSLSPLAVACLRSFGKAGVPIKLYVYERPDNVPENVKLSDANKVVVKDRLFAHKESNSYALFSDVFRYILLRNSDEVYVDTDVYCIRPLEPQDYLFAWEDDQLINGAVLRVPHDSQLLQFLLDLTSKNLVFPPWLKRRTALTAIAKGLVHRAPSIRYLPWGSAGPVALTHYIKQLGLTNLALPRRSFYPVHWLHVSDFLSPSLAVRDLISDQTSLIHLYNERLKTFDYRNAPSSSPIQEMLEGRVELD